MPCYNELDKKRIEIDSRLDGWHYIESKEEIECFMEIFSGFHDSVIQEIHYISGDYVDEDGMHLTIACDKSVQVLFDSDWSDRVEVIFDAVRILQIASPGENYLANLYDASLLIKDCEVYFYDSYQNVIPDTYQGTWARAGDHTGNESCKRQSGVLISIKKQDY